MSRAMVQAAVTMNQLQQQLDVIGHNIANSDTNGYKSRQTEFSSLLFQQINNLTHPANATGRLTPDGIRVGSGARLGSVNSKFSLGSISETGRDLDVALLKDKHFFQVQVDRNGNVETAYTRDGSFYLNPINNNTSLLLTTKDGHPVLGQNGPIILDAEIDGIDIRANGQIFARRGEEAELIDQLAIVEAIRPHLLETTGDNFFHLPNLAEQGFNLEDIVQPIANMNDTVVQNQAIERSNVDLSKQMIDLLMTQRAYQFNARTITMSDQMQGLINQLR